MKHTELMFCTWHNRRKEKRRTRKKSKVIFSSILVLLFANVDSIFRTITKTLGFEFETDHKDKVKNLTKMTAKLTDNAQVATRLRGYIKRIIS